MSSNANFYSFIVPIYNDGYLAHDLCEQIEEVMKKYLNISDLSEKIELIFINDGSKDRSLQELITLKKRFNFLKIINLSRNFGQHQAIACGYKEAKGNIIIRLNVDMQDHPRDIPLFLREIENGTADCVIGQYSNRKSPKINKLTSKLYFHVFKLLTGIDVPLNTSPLRVMSRRYINGYNLLKESHRFPQGLDGWLGFRCHYIPLTHYSRKDKASSYNFFSRTKLAINGILYFSDRPIKLVIYIGILCSLIGFVGGAKLVFDKLFNNNVIMGYTSIITVVLVAFGIQLSVTGLIGLYIGKVFTEVKGRPLYIIENEY